jgi:hypothetical protein
MDRIMKKTMIALVILASAFSSAQAQKAVVCGTKSDKVCRRVGNNGVSCYKTAYAENFKVCMGTNGYFICCESPNKYNSTNYNTNYVIVEPKQSSIRDYDNDVVYQEHDVDMTIPQSQSYAVNTSNTYEGYYPKQNYIKVCYVGNNVAEENRAPYKGCPSPQSDGPERNRQRNVNVGTHENLPPLAGRPTN